MWRLSHLLSQHAERDRSILPYGTGKLKKVYQMAVMRIYEEVEEYQIPDWNVLTVTTDHSVNWV